MWSVAYNPQEPTLFASGSDDCTVKLWSMGQPNSIFSFSARANICSVKFNPHSRYLLAYGSAGMWLVWALPFVALNSSTDHGVHYIDLRKPNQPLMELLGHKKAVSYVSFMGPNELVSAYVGPLHSVNCWPFSASIVFSSTDSELKSWHTEKGVCLRTYRGHTNDKNFVGLTVTPDFIACGMYIDCCLGSIVKCAIAGSENNSVYVYSKQVSSPMLTYQYNSARGLLVSSYSS